jgi:hypothetical protein
MAGGPFADVASVSSIIELRVNSQKGSEAAPSMLSRLERGYRIGQVHVL